MYQQKGNGEAMKEGHNSTKKEICYVCKVDVTVLMIEVIKPEKLYELEIIFKN